MSVLVSVLVSVADPLTPKSLLHLQLEMEPMAGIEPATDGLRNRCSTAELHWLTTAEKHPPARCKGGSNTKQILQLLHLPQIHQQLFSASLAQRQVNSPFAGFG